MRLLVLLAFMQPRVGPPDAFLANLAAIRAEVTYVVRSGKIATATIRGVNLGDTPDLAFRDDPAATIDGTWESDGAAEHLVVLPRTPVNFEPVEGSPGLMRGNPPTEILYDDRFAAWHKLSDASQAVQAALTDAPPYLRLAPFSWLDAKPITRKIVEHFSDVAPEIKPGICNGHPVEFAVYRKAFPSGAHLRLEVAHDPSIGYVPRSSRFLSYLETGEEFYVNEMILVSARPCDAGGFIPTEWYVVSYSDQGFDRKYPHYDEETALRPPRGSVNLIHYKATRVADHPGPVALTHLDNVRYIATAGGRIPLQKTNRELTLDRIKALAGSRLSGSGQAAAPRLPAVAEEEKYRFDTVEGRGTWPYLLGAIVVVAVAAALIVWRRYHIPPLPG